MPEKRNISRDSETDRCIQRANGLLILAERVFGLHEDCQIAKVRLETSKCRHKVVYLAARRGFAGFKVALNA